MGDFDKTQRPATTNFSDLNPTNISTNLDIQDDKEQWKREKKCHICQTPFGMVGLVYNKKYSCKFCCHAVCSKCSPQKAPHPETMSMARICSICYQKAMENHFTEGYNQELIKTKSEKEELQIRLEQEIKKRQAKAAKRKILEEKIQQIEKDASHQASENKATINALKAQKQTLLAKAQALAARIKEIEAEINQKDQILNELGNQLKELKEKYENDRNEVSELRNQLAEQQDENVRLLRKLEQFSAPPPEENKKQKKQREKEEKMRSCIEELSIQHNELVEESKRLAAELVHTESELTNRDEQIKQLQDRLGELYSASQDESEYPTNASITQEEEERIKELKEQLQEQQNLIEKLKAEVEKARERKENAFNSVNINDAPEMTRKNCADCEIF